MATQANSKSQSGRLYRLEPKASHRLLNASGPMTFLRPELPDAAASAHDVLSEMPVIIGRLVKCRGLRTTPKGIRTRRQRGR